MRTRESAREHESTALAPIADALPELRAEQYAKVREWDDAFLRHRAQAGACLRLIREELAPAGLWGGYLKARDVAEETARRWIMMAEGVWTYSNPAVPNMGTERLPEPAPTPAQEADWYSEERTSGDWVEPAPAPTRAAPVRDTYSIEQWNALGSAERLAIIIAGSEREGVTGLNKQETDNIEWARWSWNPITGCLHNCPYCYARDIANRFYAQGFAPTFLPSRLSAPAHQRVPQEAEHELGWRNIFTCSMADLFGKWVPAEWIEAVLDVARAHPQWNFLFLTKFPNRLAEFTYPKNAWLGTSVDCQARVKNAERSFANVRGGVKWLSIEPMLEPLRFTSLEMFNWVVIGGASASAKTPAWIPPRHWIADLECAAMAAGCVVYEKTNLGIGDPSRLREYPGWERTEAQLPPALRYLPTIGHE